ncbi:MAG: tetratricopeptide repeat protein [Piscinibacter sp.]|nr:tetratricopeptide repeat protein [Piscinibacter sp.]
MDASDLRLSLFGPPALVRGGAAAALPFERRTQLVALLALRRDWVPRTEIAALLWPEQPARLAFANLRKTLFRMASLPWALDIESEGAALRLLLPTDAADFETALREARPAEALALYRGELLAGFDDGQSDAWTHWAGFERERLRAAWRSAAIAQLDDAGLAAGEAVALSARLLDADPLDETALQHHLRALARAGQAGAARLAYRQFAERLSADLGLSPGTELRALHDSLSVAPRSAPVVADAPPSAAPGDDGFVGRSIELQRIADLLGHAECRLLCLIGPGGVGKTRLARRVLQQLGPTFADGALFVALEDVDTPLQFGQRLARAADVASGRGPGDALARAIDAWRERALLLVLDNFEQLAEHAPLLDRLLQACPRLKIVVTSRLRLAVAGEWSMPIEGLPCPDPEDDDRAESFDAVRLFVRAARRVEPGFAAAPERAAIVDICRLVEGLPLALELAAAWVRMLSCQAIADELRGGTELLRAADARHPPRHASIEAVFEHSWRHLTPVERDALARLSVFHGGFSIEAARAVAGASLPVLGALADKSLLAKDGARLQLHPLVQQLAAQRLDTSAARDATLAAHAAYFHRWLRPLAPATEHGQREALQAIDADFENCRRAWAFSCAPGGAEALQHSAPTLLNYFEHRARFEEGLALLRQAVDSPPGQADERLRMLLLSQAALMEMRLARFAEAEASASLALAARPATSPREARFQALAVLGGCAIATGRPADARYAYQRALELAQAGGRAHDTASTLDNLALCEKRLGHYDEALRLTLEALAQHRRHGDHARVAVCLNNLGSMLTFMDDDAAAQAHLREALELSERHGLVSTRAFVLANLTELALKADDQQAARVHAEQALEVALAGGLRTLVGWLKVQLARLATRRGELEPARALLAGGAELALTLGAQSVKPAVLLAWAELLEVQGHARAARRVLAFAADEPSLSAPDRDELRAAWARRASPPIVDPPWPGLTLEALLQGIVQQRDLAHGPLLAALDAGA